MSRNPDVRIWAVLTERGRAAPFSFGPCPLLSGVRALWGGRSSAWVPAGCVTSATWVGCCGGEWGTTPRVPSPHNACWQAGGGRQQVYSLSRSGSAQFLYGTVTAVGSTTRCVCHHPLWVPPPAVGSTTRCGCHRALWVPPPAVGGDCRRGVSRRRRSAVHVEFWERHPYKTAA